MTPQQPDVQFVSSLRTAIAAQLPGYLPNQRWFRSKARRIHSVHLCDAIPVPLSQVTSLITLVSVEFTEGANEAYVLPLVPRPHGHIPEPESVVIRVPVSDGASEQPLIDALRDREFLITILDAMLHSRSFAGNDGFLVAAPEAAFRPSPISGPAVSEPRILQGEQSNSSVIYSDRFILKIFRRLEEGIHPDLEIGRFLTSLVHFPNVPPLCGSLTYESHQSKAMTLGILQGFVPNEGDAWRVTVESLATLFASADHPTGEVDSGSIQEKSSDAPPGIAKTSGLFSNQLELIGLLGKRTAELHLALSSSSADQAFAPERFTIEVRGEIDRSFHDLAVQNFGALRERHKDLPSPVTKLAEQVLSLEDEALLILHSISEKDISTIRTRIHGDYHLGQVLFTGSDYFIIDFEGEPARPLSERRNKRSPLQDIAGMLRSFHYAARAASALAKERSPDSRISEARIDSLARQWRDMASREFLRSYRTTAGDARFLPASRTEFDALLKVHVLEKAIYELGYELNNRPAWLSIPLEGIREIVANQRTRA